MNNARALDATLDAFLADGAEEVADRVIEAALAEIDETPQRRAGRAWRFSAMAFPSRVAVAAVAIVAVATTLVVLRPDRPSISPPNGTASAVASAGASDRTSASADASLGPTSIAPSSWAAA